MCNCRRRIVGVTPAFEHGHQADDPRLGMVKGQAEELIGVTRGVRQNSQAIAPLQKIFYLFWLRQARLRGSSCPGHCAVFATLDQVRDGP
jgi:hypothetical protein